MAMRLLWVVSSPVYSILTVVSIAGQLSASTVIMVGTALLMSVAVINVYSKKDFSQPVPRWCIAIVSRFYPAVKGNATALCKIDRIGNEIEESPEVGVEGGEEWILLRNSWIESVSGCMWF